MTKRVFEARAAAAWAHHRTCRDVRRNREPGLEAIIRDTTTTPAERYAAARELLLLTHAEAEAQELAYIADVKAEWMRRQSVKQHQIWFKKHQQAQDKHGVADRRRARHLRKLDAAAYTPQADAQLLADQEARDAERAKLTARLQAQGACH